MQKLDVPSIVRLTRLHHRGQGVGSHAAHLLLRSGVGKLRLVDFDQASAFASIAAECTLVTVPIILTARCIPRHGSVSIGLVCLDVSHLSGEACAAVSLSILCEDASPQLACNIAWSISCGHRFRRTGVAVVSEPSCRRDASGRRPAQGDGPQAALCCHPP